MIVGGVAVAPRPVRRCRVSVRPTRLFLRVDPASPRGRACGPLLTSDAMALRIVLIGQAAFAEKVLHGLIARGDDVAAVYCPPDAGAKPDPAKLDPLKAAALAAGIPCHQPPSYKPDAVRAEIAALAP